MRKMFYDEGEGRASEPHILQRVSMQNVLKHEKDDFRLVHRRLLMQKLQAIVPQKHMRYGVQITSYRIQDGKASDLNDAVRIVRALLS